MRKGRMASFAVAPATVTQVADNMIDGITFGRLGAVENCNFMDTSGFGTHNVGSAPSPLVLRQAQQASAVGQSVARLLELHAGKVWSVVQMS